MLLLTTLPDLDAFNRAIPDEDTAEAVFIEDRWPNGPRCELCGSDNVGKVSTREVWQCRESPCRHQTSLRSGSVLKRSRMSYRDWAFITWRCASPAGASARSMARELGLRYETVWRMAHKVRASMAERGAWQISGPAEIAVCQVPVCKHANGDPPDRRPVAVAVSVAAERTGSTKDLLRFAVGALDEPDAELLAQARFDHVEPGAAVSVAMSRVLGPTNRVGLALADYYRRFKLWVRMRYGGVSRRYMANYLAQFAYTENRPHDQERLFAFVIRRLMQEPSREDLALAAP